MSRHPIVKIGHPVLRAKTTPVSFEFIRTLEFQKFLDEMVKVMRAAEGVGLAANQIGFDAQVFVMECQSNRRYPGQAAIPLACYINPKILKSSKEEQKDWEGCLSIPGYRGVVARAQKITFEAYARDGKKIKKTVTGFHARIIQHEIDHLNGKFYVDRMPDLKSWCHLEILKDLSHEG